MDDVAIIGGGSAGCVLAVRLSEDPARRVRLIEAGPDFPDFGQAPAAVRQAVGGVEVIEQLAAIDWGYHAEGSATSGPIALPRGRLLGGSGAINGCIWLRGLPEDFARWADMVGPAWAWEPMLPAYRAIEADPAGNADVHGRDGPFPISRHPASSWVATQAAFHTASVELGYGATDDENAPDSMGAGALPLNQQAGLRWGPQRALLTDDVRARPNLTIDAGARALRLVLDGRRVAAAEVQRADGPARITAGEFILSAGAVGSPHLLLLSGIGPSHDLRACGVEPLLSLPGVGAGIRDHPKTWIQWRLREGLAISGADPLLQTSSRYTATDSDLRGDMMLYPNSVVPGADADASDFRIEAVNNLQLSAGRLWLRSSDPDEQPAIDLQLLREERDLDRLVDAVERSLALAETAPMREVVGQLVLPDPTVVGDRAALRAEVKRTVMTGQHISSSCRMGNDDLAVVDPDCRLHGIDNLRIIDGSVMPDSIRANTHATILAMAQLMAGRIIGEGAGARDGAVTDG
jgi:choline dehydrogenase